MQQEQRLPEIAATALRYLNPKLRLYTARMAAMSGLTAEPLLLCISGRPPLVPRKCSVMLSPALPLHQLVIHDRTRSHCQAQYCHGRFVAGQSL